MVRGPARRMDGGEDGNVHHAGIWIHVESVDGEEGGTEVAIVADWGVARYGPVVVVKFNCVRGKKEMCAFESELLL